MLSTTFLALSFAAVSLTLVHGQHNVTQQLLNAKRCASIIKCSRIAKTCDCPPGCTCKFPLRGVHNVRCGKNTNPCDLNQYTINIFPKATATIDCSTKLPRKNCQNMVVNSDGNDVQVLCQGNMNCNGAKFTGQNVHVNCGANPNAQYSNSVNVCNKITCEGKTIDVKCAKRSCKSTDRSCKRVKN